MAYDTFKNITIQQLECLIHLVAEKNFSRAARKMLLTQPSLSKHIKNLEDATSVRLVNREGAGVSLTPEGKLLYDFARKVLFLREDVKERMLRLQDTCAGIIQISASTLPAAYILPQVLHLFRKQYPEIQTYVRSANSDDVIEMVLEQQSEIGFVGKMPQNKRLHSESLWRDRLILVVPPEHPWADVPSISMKELLKAPFVLRERGSATREIMGNYLTEHEDISLNQLHIIAEMGGAEAVKEAVIAGMGVSVLSVHTVKRELRQGILKEIQVQGWKIERNVYMIFRHSLGSLKRHQLFLDFVRSSDLALTMVSDMKSSAVTS